VGVSQCSSPLGDPVASVKAAGAGLWGMARAQPQNHQGNRKASRLRPTGRYLNGADLAIAALAPVTGLIDVLGEPRIRALKDVWWHCGRECAGSQHRTVQLVPSVHLG
jgi:hypothetical protein